MRKSQITLDMSISFTTSTHFTDLTISSMYRARYSHLKIFFPNF